jgi:hypothetical protein
LKPRVFVIGPKENPETLKQALNVGFEEIGNSLADECERESEEHWLHEQLRHNDGERLRLVHTVRPFLF